VVVIPQRRSIKIMFSPAFTARAPFITKATTKAAGESFSISQMTNS
jgi:hypothetical protein